MRIEPNDPFLEDKLSFLRGIKPTMFRAEPEITDMVGLNQVISRARRNHENEKQALTVAFYSSPHFKRELHVVLEGVDFFMNIGLISPRVVRDLLHGGKLSMRNITSQTETKILGWTLAKRPALVDFQRTMRPLSIQRVPGGLTSVRSQVSPDWKLCRIVDIVARVGIAVPRYLWGIGLSHEEGFTGKFLEFEPDIMDYLVDKIPHDSVGNVWIQRSWPVIL